ncbi:DNA-3-methyladenine glycosylase I [Francisella noatunensis]
MILLKLLICQILNLKLFETIQNIIRNKLKIYSVRKKCSSISSNSKEFGSLSDYLWNFVNFKQIKNSWRSIIVKFRHQLLSVRKFQKNLRKRE